MRYQKVAKWDIAYDPVQESQNWLRKFLGFGVYSRKVAIRFRNQETIFTVRTDYEQSQCEVKNLLEQLAHIRYAHHHRMGTGNIYGLDEKEGDIPELLEKFGVRLPGWLR